MAFLHGRTNGILARKRVFVRLPNPQQIESIIEGVSHIFEHRDVSLNTCITRVQDFMLIPKPH